MRTRSVLAACAVVSLCGTSYGWSLLLIGQQPEVIGLPAPEDIRPSSGFIRLAEVLETTTSSSTWVPEFNNNTFGLVTGAGSTWATRRADINNSSWFAGDSTGPDGAYTLGVGSMNRPAWNAGYATHPTYGGFGTPTGARWIGSGDGDQLVSSIDGGRGGWSFVYDIAPVFDDTPFTGMASNVSLLGGPSITDGLSYDWAESVFVGHITLTDPSARLLGHFVVNTRDGRGPDEGWELDFSGTVNFNLKVVQVRDGNPINLFIVEIPAPGALVPMAVVSVVASRRRR